MRLTPKDYRLFMKLNWALLAHTANRKGLLKKKVMPAQMEKARLEDKMLAWEAICENPQLIDEFQKQNPAGLTSEELDLLAGWKALIHGEFVIIRHLKNHSIFLHQRSNYAYGVVALADEFQEIIGSAVPVIVRTILLPFKEKIVYSGFLETFNIHFGSGIDKGLNRQYQESKARYGIITQLPFSEQGMQTDAATMLKFYLKTKHNRDYYEEEIWDLIEHKPELLIVYHQEMGRVHARRFRKFFKEIGLKPGWFGLYHGQVVASAKAKKELMIRIPEVVPRKHVKLVHPFQFKG